MIQTTLTSRVPIQAHSLFASVSFPCRFTVSCRQFWLEPDVNWHASQHLKENFSSSAGGTVRMGQLPEILNKSCKLRCK